MTSTFSIDGTITTTFEPTPMMSSYLLAFVVSDFHYISNEATMLPGETLHRIFVRSEAVTKVQYALETSENALKTMENYVNFKYELLKLDSVGIQKIFYAESWGMVAYR